MTRTCLALAFACALWAAGDAAAQTSNFSGRTNLMGNSPQRMQMQSFNLPNVVAPPAASKPSGLPTFSLSRLFGRNSTGTKLPTLGQQGRSNLPQPGSFLSDYYGTDLGQAPVLNGGNIPAGTVNGLRELRR